MFFAVLCLCVAMVLLYIILEPLYTAEVLIIDPASAEMAPNFLSEMLHLHRVSDAFIILCYTAIYAVKFSFLFFFRTLVRRIPKMLSFWRVVVAITGFAWVISSLSAWLPCPYYDIRSRELLKFLSLKLRLMHRIVSCAEKPGVSKVIGLVAFVVVLDIITDILSLTSLLLFLLPRNLFIKHTV